MVKYILKFFKVAEISLIPNPDKIYIKPFCIRSKMRMNGEIVPYVWSWLFWNIKIEPSKK